MPFRGNPPHQQPLLVTALQALRWHYADAGLWVAVMGQLVSGARAAGIEKLKAVTVLVTEKDSEGRHQPGRCAPHDIAMTGSNEPRSLQKPSQGSAVSNKVFNVQNLRGQTLLFRCLETGFVTTAPALGRYQRGRGIDPSRRELVGQRPSDWVKGVPTTTCEHCGLEIKGTQWAVKQHQRSKRCMKEQHMGQAKEMVAAYQLQ